MTYQQFLDNLQYGFRQREQNGVVYFSAPALDALGFIRHGFTSRIGGISKPPYDSLNLSFKRTPDGQTVVENFRIAAQAIGIDFEKLVACNYCHGNHVEIVGEAHHGMGITRKNTLPFCDGVMVLDARTAAVTLHGDCCAIFFADRCGRAAGACHSGWKGTYLGTVRTIVERMQSIGIRKEEMLFAIGPCISWPHYEVKEDVAGKFRPHYPHAVKERDGKLFLDLEGVLTYQLYEEQIPPENVTLAQLCTYSDSKMFYSHRRDGERAGAMGSFISLCE